MSPRRRRSEVQEWAESLDANALLCRDLGHTWQPFRAWRDAEAREYVQVLRCPRCEAERRRGIDYNGRRTSQAYDYADGYLAPAGSGALSADGRADLRLVSLLRLIEETPAQPVDLAARRRKAS